MKDSGVEPARYDHSARPETRLRLCGTALSLVLVGSLVIPVVLGNSTDPLQRAVIASALLIALGLGWYYSTRVIEGDRRTVVKVAAQIAIVGVLVGSFTSAVLLWIQGDRIDATVVLIPYYAILGVIFAGIPMAGLAFSVALVWGAVLHYWVARR